MTFITMVKGDHSSSVKKKNEAALIYLDNRLHLEVVLQPDPSWEKVGQLQQTN